MCLLQKIIYIIKLILKKIVVIKKLTLIIFLFFIFLQSKLQLLNFENEDAFDHNSRV